MRTTPATTGAQRRERRVGLSCAAVIEPYAGLADDVRDALVAVPEGERSLLELRLAWPALGDREALIAARLRLFMLTWDRFGGWQTAAGVGDGDRRRGSFQVVLYLTLHDARRRAGEPERTLADVVGELAGSVLVVGARHEQLLVSGAYPQLVFAGEVAGVLSEPGSAPGFARTND